MFKIKETKILSGLYLYTDKTWALDYMGRSIKLGLLLDIEPTKFFEPQWRIKIDLVPAIGCGRKGIPVEHLFLIKDNKLNDQTLKRLCKDQFNLISHETLPEHVATQYGSKYKYSEPVFFDFKVAKIWAFMLINLYAETIIKDAENILQKPINIKGDIGATIFKNLLQGEL